MIHVLIYFIFLMILKNEENMLRFSKIVVNIKINSLQNTLVQTCYILCSFYNNQTFFSLKHILVSFTVHKTGKSIAIKTIFFIPRNKKVL